MKFPACVFVIVKSGASTVMLAVAELPVPAFVELTVPVVFTSAPPPVPVTFTANTQLLFAGIVPPVSEIVCEPAAAVITPAPQAPDSPFGVATTSPVGKLSVIATPASAVVVLGLLIVNVSEVLPPTEMLGAPNALLTAGGERTVNVAVLLPAPAPLSFDETGPVVLFSTPTVVAVTFTEKLHVAPAASVAPERLTTPPPAAAVIVPLGQLPVSPVGVATIIPAGKLSVNPMPSKLMVVFGLFTAKLNEVEPFTGTVAAPKVFVTAGAAATVTFADAVLPVPPFAELTAPVVFV